VVLHDLEITGSDHNGVNCDDGGDMANPEASHHLVFRRLSIHDIGGDGNQDCLKLSGIRHFRVEDCELARCGGNGSGSGVDHVGCQQAGPPGRVTGLRLLLEAPRHLVGVQLGEGLRVIGPGGEDQHPARHLHEPERPAPLQRQPLEDPHRSPGAARPPAQDAEEDHGEGDDSDQAEQHPRHPGAPGDRLHGGGGYHHPVP